MQDTSARHSVTLQERDELQCSQRPSLEDTGELLRESTSTLFLSLFPEQGATIASGISSVSGMTNHQGWLRNRRVCLSCMHILSFCIGDLRRRTGTSVIGRLYVVRATGPQALRFPLPFLNPYD